MSGAVTVNKGWPLPGVSGSVAMDGLPNGAAAGAPAPAPTLPCQDSNNGMVPEFRQPSRYAKKAAFALVQNVAYFAQTYGLEQLLDLTLTFRANVLTHAEAYKHWRSLRTNILNVRYRCWLRVKERQDRGAIHFHVLLVVEADMRSGFDFGEWDRYKAAWRESRQHSSGGRFRWKFNSANAELRAEWKFWRKTAPLYGFGRVTALPIRSTQEAIAQYYGKYIGKDFSARQAEDKGARMVEYSRNASRCCSLRFSWLSPGSWVWRHKVGLLAAALKVLRVRIKDLADYKRVFGSRWAYYLAPIFAAMQLPSYPTKAHAVADGLDVSMLPEGATEITGKRSTGPSITATEAAQFALAFADRKGVRA